MPPSRRDVAVIVPAGGSGTRMGSPTAKQYLDLGGAPVLTQTVRALAAHPQVGQIVLALPASEGASSDFKDLMDALHLPVRDLETARRTTDALGGVQLTVVAGGASRRASVENGLRAVDAAMELVLVHDAVRPFVTVQMLDDVIAAARAHGAAVPAVPVADTLRRADGETFGETVDRTGVYAVQTPQGFRRDLLERAFADVADDTTDDAALVAALGHPVRLVPGDRRNLKLTTPDDLALARVLWGDGPA